ncbi:MAG: hypothetical protein MK110_06895 [Fuerstiella sp.]|nr:hypothetical protein [Fuerstiella sp.]
MSELYHPVNDFGPLIKGWSLADGASCMCFSRSLRLVEESLRAGLSGYMPADIDAQL